MPKNKEDTLKDKEDTLKDITQIQRSFISECQRHYSYHWRYGYAIDSLKLSCWLVSLDNIYQSEIEETYPNLHKLLGEHPLLEDFAEQIALNPQVQFETIHYLESTLATLSGDKAVVKKLNKLEEKLLELNTQFAHGNYFQNPNPLSDCPPDILAKLRFNNPYHSYRWHQGKRYNQKGTSLAIVSEWIPDLEALCAILSYINDNRVPLNFGYDPIQELVPIGGRKAVAMEDLESFTSCLVTPAKRLRRPAIRNESVLAALTVVSNIDFDILFQDLANFNKFVQLMDDIQKEQYKEHLFLPPFKIGDEGIPEPTPPPQQFSKLSSCRAIPIEQEGSNSERNSAIQSLLRDFTQVSNLLRGLNKEELQKLVSNLKATSLKQLRSIIPQIQKRKLSHREDNTGETNISDGGSGLESSSKSRKFRANSTSQYTPNHNLDGAPQSDSPVQGSNHLEGHRNQSGIQDTFSAPDHPTADSGSASSNESLIELRNRLMQDRSQVKIKVPDNPNNSLKHFEQNITQFNESEDKIDHELINAAIEGDAWLSNPSGASSLCKGLMAASGNKDYITIANSDKVDKLYEMAAQNQNPTQVAEVISICKQIATDLSPDQLKALQSNLNQLPDLTDILHEEYCKREASKLIITQKWDNLPTKDKIKLSRLANEKHIFEVAEQTIEQFLTKEHLSQKDLHNMGLLTSNAMGQLIKILEGEIESPGYSQLLNKMKEINSQYSDLLNSKINSADYSFILECQIWLLSICQFINTHDDQEYLRLIRDVESLFVTVWKKVEEQLSPELISQ